MNANRSSIIATLFLQINLSQRQLSIHNGRIVSSYNTVAVVQPEADSVLLSWSAISSVSIENDLLTIIFLTVVFRSGFARSC